MSEPPNPPEGAGGRPAGEGESEPLAGHAPRAPPAPRPGREKGEERAEPPPPPAGPPDPPPPADTPLPGFISALQTALAGAVTHVSLWVGDWSIVVPASRR